MPFLYPFWEKLVFVLEGSEPMDIKKDCKMLLKIVDFIAFFEQFHIFLNNNKVVYIMLA